MPERRSLPAHIQSLIGRTHAQHQLRSWNSPLDAADKPLPGQVRPARLPSSKSPEEVVLIAGWPKGGIVPCVLLADEADMATNFDLVIPPNISKLPVGLVLQGDLLIPITEQQLGLVVAVLPDEWLEAIPNLAIGDCPNETLRAHQGLPVIDDDDPRRAYKREQVGRAQALSSEAFASSAELFTSANIADRVIHHLSEVLQRTAVSLRRLDESAVMAAGVGADTGVFVTASNEGNVLALTIQESEDRPGDIEARVEILHEAESVRLVAINVLLLNERVGSIDESSPTQLTPLLVPVDPGDPGRVTSVLLGNNSAYVWRTELDLVQEIDVESLETVPEEELHEILERSIRRSSPQTLTAWSHLGTALGGRASRLIEELLGEGQG